MNSILKTDFYKVTHMLQYRDNITHFTSYLTPRGSRFKSIDKMVVFGIANFVNEYLFKGFNEEFFNVEWPVVRNEVVEVLEKGLGYPQRLVNNTLVKIGALHNLGYLPIEINGLPEGSICPMQVPAIEIRSTDSAFAWVAQSIESLLSCEFWHPTMSATIAHEYAKIAKAAYDKTTNVDYRTAMCDFSMRGQESYESAVASGAGFLTSFYNCSTVESRYYIKRNYVHGDEVRVNGLTSTEHSVMCSDFSLCGDERETLKRLLTEVYPDVSFSAVSDSRDFWHLVTEILPTLKEEIENHKGFIGIRHDCYTKTAQLLTPCGWKYIKDLTLQDKVAQFENGNVKFVYPSKIINEPYKGEMYRFWSDKFDINTIVTPNHRMVRYNKNKKEFQVIKADAMNYYDGCGLPRNGLLKGKKDRKLTPMEKLLIAYQADGYCTKSCLDKTEQFERGYTIKFQFSKEKKIQHLIEICEEGNFEYWIRDEHKPHKNSQKDETSINVKIYEKPIKRFKEWIDLSDKGIEWCKDFIEEISYWDCRIRKDFPYIYEYVNTNDDDSEMVQTIGALCGYNTHYSNREDNRKEHYLNCNYVTINKKRNQPCQTVHKEKIEEYDGRIYCVNVPSGQLVIRDNSQIFISGNSSEPVHALCGIKELDFSYNLGNIKSQEDFEREVCEWFEDAEGYGVSEEDVYIYYNNGIDFYDGVFTIVFNNGVNYATFTRKNRTPEDKGMVEVLYDIFGGEFNSKGYIELYPKVKAVYGDSITLPRAKEIYKRLEDKGFAANNVSLGVGSFSMECLEEDGVLKPFTRDSFSIAVKATYGRKRIANGEVGFPIFKDPKGCEGKKSLKGLCRVVKKDGEFKVIQNLTEEEYNAYQTHEMVNYFKDGKPVKYSFEDVRNRLEENI